MLHLQYFVFLFPVGQPLELGHGLVIQLHNEPGNEFKHSAVALKCML